MLRALLSILIYFPLQPLHECVHGIFLSLESSEIGYNVGCIYSHTDYNLAAPLTILVRTAGITSAAMLMLWFPAINPALDKI
jgi:hypothetical protein